jgi:hypothetical protein
MFINNLYSLKKSCLSNIRAAGLRPTGEALTVTVTLPLRAAGRPGVLRDCDRGKLCYQLAQQ